MPRVGYLWFDFLVLVGGLGVVVAALVLSLGGGLTGLCLRVWLRLPVVVVVVVEHGWAVCLGKCGGGTNEGCVYCIC